MERFCLILGFFDGVHKGHEAVIKSAVEYAKKNDSKTVLITFKTSPSEYFAKGSEYIYTRELSYELMYKLGVDIIKERNFADLASISAGDYLKELVETYSPRAIFTGFNHTFGYNREGSPEYLEKEQAAYGYEYFCIPAYQADNEIVSSTLIKEYIRDGNLAKVNSMLTDLYTINSEVIHGEELGRKLGFPTANMIYPANCAKLPYGVYISETPYGKGILNWGIKPTVNGRFETLEVHIPGFSGNLYGENLRIKVVKKIRDEKKFNSLDELKFQIAKDTEECLRS